MNIRRPNFELKVSWNKDKKSAGKSSNLKSSWASIKSISSNSSAYLFAKDRNPKCQKERKIQEFLNSIQILQINIGVAFEEY